MEVVAGGAAPDVVVAPGVEEFAALPESSVAQAKLTVNAADAIVASPTQAAVIRRTLRCRSRPVTGGSVGVLDDI